MACALLRSRNFHAKLSLRHVIVNAGFTLRYGIVNACFRAFLA